MAFDITPYVDMSPKKVRELIRKGVIDFPTARYISERLELPTAFRIPAAIL